MALEWCDHVDGISIFPKLPVYLRTYGDTFTHNHSVRQAVRQIRESTKRLRELNNESAQSVPTSIDVHPRASIISIVGSDNPVESTRSMIVSGIVLSTSSDNATSITSSQSAEKRKRGPIAERSCINCRFHLLEENRLDTDESKQCQGRFRNGKCDRPRHPKYIQHLEKDDNRKQKIKEGRESKKGKTAPETTGTVAGTAEVAVTHNGSGLDS